MTSAEGTPQDLPAYAYQELIQLSYQSPPLAQDLASYLAVEALNQKATVGRLKSLKTLDQLTRHGSKHFRRALRELDEHLRAASRQSVTAHPVTGSTYDEAVRNLARDIRLFLFEESLIQSDELDGQEEPLQSVSNLGGLGSSGHRGKYEGFGNAPVTPGINMRDLHENVDGVRPFPRYSEVIPILFDDGVFLVRLIHFLRQKKT